MTSQFEKMLQGYQTFRSKYTEGDFSIMQHLSSNGQQPEAMVVACCDSRVDPALILQCDPGDLFVVRNVANIVPPFEKDNAHHGTSAALEFGIRFLEVKHLILLGHSQCGGIQSLLNLNDTHNNDFITNWVTLVKSSAIKYADADEYARFALQQSYKNCLTFPWVKEKIEVKKLTIHLWYFDIQTGEIYRYSPEKNDYILLES